MNRYQILFAASLSAVLLAYSDHAAAEAESIPSQVQRQQEELERYYASLEPVLTKDTVLAGIAMPKGTTLYMPNRYRLNTDRWTEPKYFLRAEFPRPVVWQGVPIVAINRDISFPDLFMNDPPSLPPTWGAEVNAELAVPQTVGGLDCQVGRIGWQYPATKRIDISEVSDTDAAQAAPTVYRLSGCLSAGQRFYDQRQVIEMKLPANSYIFQNRIIGDSYPDGFLDVWSANDYGLEQRLSFNLFELSASNFSLNLDDRSLHQFSGRVVEGRADCPLKSGSTVAWHQHRPDILDVYGEQPDTPRCGKLHIEVLQELPPEVAIREIYLPLIVTGEPE